jgi:hypothetical protein
VPERCAHSRQKGDVECVSFEVPEASDPAHEAQYT